MYIFVLSFSFLVIFPIFKLLCFKLFLFLTLKYIFFIYLFFLFYFFFTGEIFCRDSFLFFSFCWPWNRCFFFRFFSLCININLSFCPWCPTHKDYSDEQFGESKKVFDSTQDSKRIAISCLHIQAKNLEMHRSIVNFFPKMLSQELINGQELSDRNF